MSDSIQTKDLFACRTPYLTALFSESEYPWDILKQLNAYMDALLQTDMAGFTEIAPQVFVGKNVKIYPTATVEPPCVLGENTVVRPGAFLRGYVITGADCVIGNSSELKHAVLLEHVQVPHYNYVGDSVLGNGAHMGAGSICSNLKSDGKNVIVHGQADYETGLRKLGGILADGADIGCGSVINPGTVVGKNTSVYPLTPLRGVYAADSIVKSSAEIVKRK